jgi:hypothetical protein
MVSKIFPSNTKLFIITFIVVGWAEAALSLVAILARSDTALLIFAKDGLVSWARAMHFIGETKRVDTTLCDVTPCIKPCERLIAALIRIAIGFNANVAVGADFTRYFALIRIRNALHRILFGKRIHM